MILKAQYELLHPWASVYLQEQRERDPKYSVLDVGGVAMPWASEFDPDYLDIQPNATFAGDACLRQTWDQLNGRIYDFSICTNTLEDLRDPAFVIGQLQAYSKMGFISTPHKHTELGKFDSSHYDHVGYCHHRWIFNLRNDVLRMVAKFPAAAQLGPGETPGPQFLTWHDPSLVKKGELGFIWQTDFSYEYIRGDFAGLAHEGCNGILRMYQDELAEGL